MASTQCSGAKGENFLRQFRDLNTRDFKKITAGQFMDVWNHYDTDGKSKLCWCFGLNEQKINYFCVIERVCVCLSCVAYFYQQLQAVFFSVGILEFAYHLTIPHTKYMEIKLLMADIA